MMKQILNFVLLISFMGMLNIDLSAQHHVRRNKAIKRRVVAKRVLHRNMTINNANKVLRRTNFVILSANRAVKKNKVYTGYLAKSVAHQRFAKRLYNKHNYHRSISHSRLARLYAFKAIKANKGSVKSEWKFNAEEKELFGTTIPDTDLEKEMKSEMPDVSYDDSKVSKKEMTEIEVLETSPDDYKGDN